MNEQSPLLTDDRLLPWPDVRPIAGISRTTAWRLQNSGDFPRPVMLSPGRVGWRESEVKAWRATRVHRGDPAPAPLFEPPPQPCPKPAITPAVEPAPSLSSKRAAPRLTRRSRRSDADAQLSFDFHSTREGIGP